MPPLTLTNQRFGALQRPPARFHRGETPLRSAPPFFARRRRTEKGSSSSSSKVANVIASALDGNVVASTSSTSSTSSLSSSSIADAKASLRAAAPAARSGDPAAIAVVLAAVERLAELAAAAASAPSPTPSSSSSPSSSSTPSSSSPSSSPSSPFPPPPEPSAWETLFTDAKQGSNGKVGPLQGEARQLFGVGSKFLNRVSIPSDALPLLRADFGGRWEQRAGRADRVEVVFEESGFYVLGGLRVAGSAFPPPGQKGSLKGHWTMKFADDDVRAFVTNKLSVVVLGRVEEKKKK